MGKKRVSYTEQKYKITTRSTFINSLRNTLAIGRNFFIRRHNLTSPNKTPNPPFFIIGAGRSGNTLLRAIITSNKEVAIPPESYVIGPLVKKWSSINYLPWKDVVKIVVGEFEAHHNFYTWDLNFYPSYERLYRLKGKDRSLSRIIEEMFLFYAEQKFPNATRWGDKTPRNTFFIQWVMKLYPDAQFIHIIRDGRDVVKSYLNASFWKHGIKEAAEEWKEAVESGISLRSLPTDKYMEVKYEDLVNNPGIEISKVCTFLNIKFSEEMLTPYAVAEQLGDSSKDYHTNLSKPISNKSVGEWKNFFSTEQANELNDFLNDQLKLLGYL